MGTPPADPVWGAQGERQRERKEVMEMKVEMERDE